MGGGLERLEPARDRWWNAVLEEAARHQMRRPACHPTGLDDRAATVQSGVGDHGQGPDHPSEYQDGPRSAVSFRMTERLQDRLREYAHRARRKKQDILDQAVHEFLRREGY